MMKSREWNGLDNGERLIIEQFQNDLPVSLSAIARGLGLSVKAATLAPGVSGEIRPSGDGSYVIRVNRHDVRKRQRFTVAHEIAHYLLHRDKIGDGIEDDVLYRSGLSSSIEAEANRLAADILMPWDKVMELRDEAKEIGVGDEVLYISEKFGVSEAAMRIKLGL
jgi:hypothetical protein